MKRLFLGAILGLVMISPLFAADSYVEDMTAATSISAGDLFYSVLNPATTPLDRKITGATLLNIIAAVDDNTTKTQRLIGLVIGTNVLSPTGSIAANTVPSMAVGDLIYASSGSALARVPAGATGKILMAKGAAIPEYTPYTMPATVPTNGYGLISDGTNLVATASAFGTAAYTASTAYMAAGTVPTAITLANEASDTTCFPLFGTAATGDLGPKTNASLTFNASTGALGATSFVSTATDGNHYLLGYNTEAHPTPASSYKGAYDTMGSTPAPFFSNGTDWIGLATLVSNTFTGAQTFSGSGTLTSPPITTDLHSVTAGTAKIGTAALPFSDIYFAGSSGTPATNHFRITGASTGGARSLTMADGNVTMPANPIGGTLGATTNVIPKANGTGTATLQASGITEDGTKVDIGALNLVTTGTITGQTELTIDTDNQTIVASTVTSHAYINNIGTTTAKNYVVQGNATGRSLCFRQYPGNTGVITVHLPGTHYVNKTSDGTFGTQGKGIKSTGAAGEFACILGIDSTHWLTFGVSGTWPAES